MKQTESKLKNRLLIFTFIVSNLYILVFTNLFFYSTFGADYERYIDYIKYFFGDLDKTGLEQGTLYFFLISLSINFSNDFLNSVNLQSSISFSIQIVNTLLLFIGSYFYFVYFKYHKFEESKILIVLILTSFLPQVTALRITMKPEILVFTLLPILLIHAELFIKKKKLKNLLIFFFTLVLIISTKGTFFVLIPIFLILFYLKFIKSLGYKAVTLMVLIFTFISIPIFTENYIKNESSLLVRSNFENYNNKANLNILYKNDYGDKRQLGLLKFDENTVFGITLLDTFDDHFNFYWNKDVSLFKKYRKQIFIPSDNDKLFEFDLVNRFIFYSGPLKEQISVFREYSAIIQTVILYFLIFFFSFKDSKYKFIYLSPMLGISILYLNSLGIPENNFDPLKADTFKSFYYSPLLILSIMFCLLYISKKRYFKYFLPFFIILNLHIYGFPKQDSSAYFNELETRNSSNTLCNVNRNIIYDIKTNSVCMSQKTQVCKDYLDKIEVYDISNFLLKKYNTKYVSDNCVINRSTNFSKNLIYKAPFVSLIYLILIFVNSMKLRFDN